jgi:LCP family protein required for cell wall assembly
MARKQHPVSLKVRILAWGLLLMLVPVGVAAGALYNVFQEVPAGDLLAMARAPGERAFAKKNKLNILCLGVDYNHDSKSMLFTKFARTDTNFVISVDRAARRFNILSIPRDLYVEIPDIGWDRMNAVYAREENGARKLTVKTVEHLLGVPIDHYVIIKPYAAERVVDALGGVTLNVEKDMDYDDNWGQLHIHLKKGVQRLNGSQAVGYARFRADEEGDRGRMRRQQQFMAAIAGELKKFQTLPKLNAVTRALRDNIETTLDFAQVIDLGLLYRGFDRSKMRTAKLDGDDVEIGGAMVIELDVAKKDELVKKLLR